MTTVLVGNKPPATRDGGGDPSLPEDGGQPTLSHQVSINRQEPPATLLVKAIGPPFIFPQILDPCWCPTELVVKGEHKEFPLPPASSKEFNFTNGAGMSYEARHVRECLRKGKDVEDSGVGSGRASLVREMDGLLPTHQPLKQLCRTTSPKTPWGTICLNVLLCLMGSWNYSSFGVLGVSRRVP